MKWLYFNSEYGETESHAGVKAEENVSTYLYQLKHQIYVLQRTLHEWSFHMKFYEMSLR